MVWQEKIGINIVMVERMQGFINNQQISVDEKKDAPVAVGNFPHVWKTTYNVGVGYDDMHDSNEFSNKFVGVVSSLGVVPKLIQEGNDTRYVCLTAEQYKTLQENNRDAMRQYDEQFRSGANTGI